MTKRISTKKALIASLLSLMLCVSMLVGSTFAWFTDTATTGVNTIQAGNLDVTLEMMDNDGNWVSAEGKTLQFLVEGKIPAEGTQILWEPGCTYSLPLLRVRNDGNLALKYKVAITGINGSAKLNQAIEWTITGTEDSTLTAGESHEFSISGHMKEDAGNEYKDLKIDGISITVYATQYTYEKDSKDDQYDKDAQYPTYPAGMTKDSFTGSDKAVDEKGNFYASFKDAMENVEDGGTLYFKEGETIDFPTHLNVTKNITIYGNGADFSGKDISIGTYAAPVNKETTINIYNAKNLVVWGQPTANLSDSCTWNVNFYGCTNDGYNFLMYRGGETATAKINLTLQNCKANGFSDSIVHTTADGSIKVINCEFTNNCAPINIAHKQAGTMNVTVENSKFVGCGKIKPEDDYFAPARFVNNNANGTLNVTLTNNTFTDTIGTNGDILLGDYRTGKESHAIVAVITTATPVMVKSSEKEAYSYNGGTIVIGMDTVSVGTQNDLDTAIKDKTNVVLELATGTYTLPSLDGKTLLISGTKDTVINMENQVNKAKSLILEGVTVKFANENYKGFQHTESVIYKNCTIHNLQFLYAEDVEFIGCTFEQSNDDSYHVWTYGAKNVTFTDCVFKSTSSSKSVLCYIEGTGNTFTRTFNRCVFEATGTAEKSAIMVNPSAYAGTNTYIININDCIATGYAENGIAGQTIIGVKETVKDNITITIDGNVVYTH